MKALSFTAAFSSFLLFYNSIDSHREIIFLSLAKLRQTLKAPRYNIVLMQLLISIKSLSVTYFIALATRDKSPQVEIDHLCATIPRPLVTRPDAAGRSDAGCRSTSTSCAPTRLSLPLSFRSQSPTPGLSFLRSPSRHFREVLPPPLLYLRPSSPRIRGAARSVGGSVDLVFHIYILICILRAGCALEVTAATG